MTHIGLDEAGRGPVLGSMFVAGVSMPPNHPVIDQIVESKTTTTTRITRIVHALYDADDIRVCVREVPAGEIDTAESITTLTAQVMNELSHALADASDTTQPALLADACHTSPEQFEAHFDTARFDSTTIEHSADEEYPSVSAAGCVAKFHREQHIKTLTETYPDFTIGSGYPSDTTTRNFLEAYYSQYNEFPAETRRSWNTCDDIQAELEN